MCKVLKHHGVLLRLSSQAGKAAWPFETKSYALGSRKKVLLQCWKTGEMDAPVVFKGFLAFLFQEKITFIGGLQRYNVWKNHYRFLTKKITITMTSADHIPNRPPPRKIC